MSGWLVASLGANLLLVSLWLSEWFCAKGFQAAAVESEERYQKARMRHLDPKKFCRVAGCFSFSSVPGGTCPTHYQG